MNKDFHTWFSFNHWRSATLNMPQICFRPELRPDPTGGAHDAPPDSLIGWGGGCPSPFLTSSSTSAPRPEFHFLKVGNLSARTFVFLNGTGDGVDWCDRQLNYSFDFDILHCSYCPKPYSTYLPLYMWNLQISDSRLLQFKSMRCYIDAITGFSYFSDAYKQKIFLLRQSEIWRISEKCFLVRIFEIIWVQTSMCPPQIFHHVDPTLTVCRPCSAHVLSASSISA